jgi:hypothetical protein
MSKCAFVFILEKDFNQPEEPGGFYRKRKFAFHVRLFVSDYGFDCDVISVNHRLRVPLRL